MNWKIIFQLSLFGLIMAIGTISLIPQRVEPVFWLIIFVFCSWVIAKVCTGNFFLNGFFVSLVNCIWITIIHTAFHKSYVANHPDVAQMSTNMPGSLAVHPRLAMVIIGSVSGILSGIILGVFALIASKIVTQKSIV